MKRLIFTLPDETIECTAEIGMGEKHQSGKTEIVAELLQRSDIKRYPVPAVR